MAATLVDATYRIQSNSGTVTTAATTVTPSLPNPTQPGSTLLMYVCTTGGTTAILPAADPPWYQDQATAGRAYAWRRDDQPQGETSWTVSGTASTVWAWRVEEWAGWSTAGQPDAMATGFNQHTGLQANITAAAAADITDFAALGIWWISSGTAAWPAGRTYDSGFSETGYLTVGTGTGTNDFAVAFAEAYPGASGTVQPTMTFDTTGGGTYSEKGVWCWVACYRPGVPAPPTGVLTG